jgi:hypothetical protein
MSSFWLRHFNLSTTLNLKAFGSMSSTFKPKFTMANKGNMKALWRFIQFRDERA